MRYLLIALFVLGCTKPGEKTGIGAAAGGAIGAGLGAIVGNQVGNPGEGLVVGAAVGAGAGALVANALEAQDQASRQQDEAMERQEQLIRAQRNQIDSMREGSDVRASADIASPPIAPLRTGSNPTTGVRGTSRAAPGDLYLSTSPSSFNRPTASMDSPAPALVSPQQLQTGFSSVKRAESAPVIPLRSEVVPPKLAAPSSDIGSGEVRASEVRAGMKPLLETDIPVQNNTVQKQTVRNEVNEKATADTVRKEVVSSAGPVSSKVCTDAKPEIDKAEKAQDAGDKLFHYRRALRICPEDADTHVKIGDLYLSLGRKEDALFEYEEAKKLNSNFPGITEKIESAR